MNAICTTLRGREDTMMLGKLIGARVEPGEVICLDGPMGSGKTTLTQAIAIGLSIPAGEVINSPTFTVVSEHHSGRIPLFHFDFYRLRSVDELYGIGFDEYIDAGGVTAIEWSNRIPEALPRSRVSVVLGPLDNSEERSVEISGTDNRSWAMANSIREAMGLDCT